MTFNAKRVAFLFFFSILFFLLPGLCLADNITVNLVWKFQDPGWLEIEVKQGTYTLNHNQTQLIMKTGDSFKIGCSTYSRFLLVDKEIQVLEQSNLKLFAQDQGVFRIREPGKDWISYRGNLIVASDGMGWKLSNILDSEDYLKGVVPTEMSNSWAARGFQALKAQAVAARTYMVKNIDKTGSITDSPNIHQAYSGKSVEGEASRAVEETEGEILVDETSGQTVSVFYSSHNGGYSEETENVWENDDPHYSANPDPFSEGIGGYTDSWSFYISADVLGSGFGLAPIRELHLKNYISGRVYEVKLVDWLGKEKTVSGGEFVRKYYPSGDLSKNSFLGRLFKVKKVLPVSSEANTIALSDRFIKNTPPPGPLLSRLNSSNGGLSDYERNFGGFVFKGRGWGHGVGMSQWGAYNMAMKGYSYQDILNYYYKNTSLIKRQ